MPKLLTQAKLCDDIPYECFNVDPREENTVSYILPEVNLSKGISRLFAFHSVNRIDQPTQHYPILKTLRGEVIGSILYQV